MKSAMRHIIIKGSGAFILAGLGIIMASLTLSAQSAVETSITSNGGDIRSGSYGELYSTIGEPIAEDPGIKDDGSTFTGFWQVNNPHPEAGIREEAGSGTFAATNIASATPDPFSTVVSVELRLARYGMVELKAYDLLGREAARLVGGPRDAGALRVEWQPVGLPAGSYLLRLTVNGEEQGTRLVHYYK
jgi:hypothetical protein